MVNTRRPPQSRIIIVLAFRLGASQLMFFVIVIMIGVVHGVFVVFFIVIYWEEDIMERKDGKDDVGGELWWVWLYEIYFCRAK